MRRIQWFLFVSSCTALILPSSAEPRRLVTSTLWEDSTIFVAEIEGVRISRGLHE